MLTVDINHPQAIDFITAKDDLTKVTGANISVKIDDEFMELMDPTLGKGTHRDKVWDKLIHQAWKSAEPGVLFWDKIKSESIPSCYGEEWEETSTNPCGEIPLCPYDSCRLLSVNLTKFVKNPFTHEAEFDWEAFERVVYMAQKLMDDVVDLEEEKINKILEKIENDPESEEIKAIEKNLWIKIKGKLLQGRRTGLSGIGLADTLAMLGISYSNGIDTSESIYKQLAVSAYKSSIDMAKDREAFPIWDINKENIFNSTIDTPKFLKRIEGELDRTTFRKFVDYGRRNIALLTIPPSGTISLLAGISSGIEPVYQLSYKRRRKVDKDHPNVSFVDKNGDSWEEYEVFHPKFKEYLDIKQEEISNRIGEDFKKNVKEGRFSNEEEYKERQEFVNNINNTNPYLNSTAYELNPIDRVKMQGAIQKWVDHSISSTINLPKEATEEDVANIYMTAWKEGLKGVTIYRDECRDGVLVSHIKEESATHFKTNNAPKRPKELPCDIYNPTAHGQQYIVAVGLYEGRPYEVFAFKAEKRITNDTGIIKKFKRGRYDIMSHDGKFLVVDITSDMSQIEEDKTRLISAALRHGADIKFLVEQLNKAKGNGFQDFSKVIARTLKRYIKDNDTVTGTTCDSCGSDKLIYKDGCVECESCGIQKC